MQELAILLALLLFLALTPIFPARDGLGELSEAEKHNNRGVDLQEKKRLQEAISECDEAIRLDPEFAEAYYNRGSAYNQNGQHDLAIADYN